MNRFEEVIRQILEAKTPCQAPCERTDRPVLHVNLVMLAPVEHIAIVGHVSLPRPRLPRRRAIKKT